MDEKLSISITKDRMQAYMVFSPPSEDGEKIPFERVKATIAAYKVIYGVNEEYLKTVYLHREYEREYKVAEGKQPQHGIDAKIEFKVDIKKDVKPKIDEYGNVDYLNVDRYSSVKAGDVLAVYTPPTQGVSGIDVFGKVIPARKGKQTRLPVGKNVKIEDDGVTITAKIDGLVEYVDGRLMVDPVLYISTDVDVGTGNIDFIGNVQIRGSVRNGMHVKAGGNVEVNGMVENSVIEAGGDVVLNGGIKGMGKAMVKAGGKVTARYIENSNIIAHGAVTAASVLQSNIETHDSVTVLGPRGSIIGGNIRAQNFVDCKCIGSVNSPTTNIFVGMPPEMKKELAELETEVKVIAEEIKNLEKVTSIDDNMLSEQQKTIKIRLMKERFEKKGEYTKKTARINELHERMYLNERSYIAVSDTTFVGTVLTINNAVLTIRSEYKFTTFRVLDGEIMPTQHA